MLYAVLATALARLFAGEQTLGAVMERAVLLNDRERAILARGIGQVRTIAEIVGRADNYSTMWAGLDRLPLVELAEGEEAITISSKVRHSDYETVWALPESARREMGEMALEMIETTGKGLVARDATGQFQGALFSTEHGEYLHIEAMMSMGKVRGVGRKLVRALGKQALKEERGITLASLPGAEGFYAHLGFGPFPAISEHGFEGYRMRPKTLEAFVKRGTRDDPLNPKRAFKLKPERALSYFKTLTPGSKVPPDWLDRHRRSAFRMAEVTEATVLKRVHSLVYDAIEEGKITVRDFKVSLEDFGVTSKNPQYAEMVFRTNALDSYNTGYYDEVREDPDLQEYFPYWEYLAVEDDRLSDEHAAHLREGEGGGPYFPASRSFDSVRGDRVFNCRCSFRWVDKFEAEELGLVA